MTGATKMLLEGAIDFAGLFPPAEMELPAAIDEYRKWQNSPEHWVLNRFVCPSRSLRSLGELLERRQDSLPLEVCVLGRPSHHRESWEAALELDVDDLNVFQQAYEELATIESYEIRLPDGNEIQSYFRDLQGFSSVDVFVELPWAEWMEEALNGIAESEWLGAKVRTGGTSAESFPSARELATFIRAGVSFEIPLKATAGLHEPLSHRDALTGADAFGFVNLLAAVTLAGSSDLSIREIEQLLRSEDSAEWEFSPDSFRWRDWAGSEASIHQARELFGSFGSCSIVEPLDGLQKLGW